jgi:hypothetical protein
MEMKIIINHDFKINDLYFVQIKSMNTTSL